MPDFDSFKDFKSRIQSDQYSSFRDAIARGITRSGRAPTAQLAAGSATPAEVNPSADFAKMQDFVNKFYAGVDAVHTFLDAAGNHIDCIPFEQQPSVQAAEKQTGKKITGPVGGPAAQWKPMAAGQGGFGPGVMNVVPQLRRGGRDLFGAALSCPAGCVPVRRITLNQIANQGTFNTFFQKPPVSGSTGPTPYADENGFIHHHGVAIAQQTVFGASTWLNLWARNPSPGTMTLSQLWIRGTSAGGVFQTIESGWTVNPAQWGSSVPVLFVFFNPSNYDGISSGWVTNQNMHGFVQTSSDWVIGGAIPGPYSDSGGAQIGLRIQWQLNANRDWVLYISDSNGDLAEVGYYPNYLYDLGGPTNWWEVDFGGEVASQQGSWRTGPMGSGLAPTGSPAADFGQVAFQKQLGVLSAIGASSIDSVDVTPVNDPRDAPYSCTTGNSAAWGSFIFFGGTGT